MPEHGIGGLPFDAAHLDRLLDSAGIDVALVTSKHNLQYLLGGYKFFFFANFDAIGISRYFPVLIYPKGRAQDAVYIGNSMEDSEAENGRFWCPTVITETSGTLDATSLAIAHIKRLGLAGRPVGAELSFFPADGMDLLRSSFSGPVVDAQFPLERLRAVKRPDELHLIREASERVVDSMAATFAQARPGMTKRELNDVLRDEETRRGLTFDYCLLTAGRSFNRAPSGQVLTHGDILSLDSGGSYCGYVGDLCRMGVIGEPDGELVALLAAVERIQQAARQPIGPGRAGAMILSAADEAMRSLPYRGDVSFVAHGMGIIGHEAPRLTSSGPVKYPAVDAELPLQDGMVLSVETTLMHPRRGYIKLEDTLAVTATGWTGYGDGARGWNVARG